MTHYEKIQKRLRESPKSWLITGAAGFIGSHLLEKLLRLNQQVIGLDNFETGRRKNLNSVRQIVGAKAWNNLTLIKGNILNLKTCRTACEGVDYVLHEAALGSVSRSVEDPIKTNDSNVTGFLNMLVAARDAKVSRFVYASSSSVYGDDEELPKIEERIGRPLSPYAITKYVNELYASVFGRCYNFSTIGLRYFNVFGPRQDPNGPYAAVIPKWLAAIHAGESVYIYGDGETSRDFCPVANVVQSNLLAATTRNRAAENQVFNIACNDRTTLNELFALLREMLLPGNPSLRGLKPRYAPFRKGDVRHSFAQITRAQKLLGYQPAQDFAEGLRELGVS